MRRAMTALFLAGIALALGLVGCTKKGPCRGERGAAGLLGTWSVDGAKTVAAMGGTASLKPEERSQLAAAIGNATVKITKDTLTMSGLRSDDVSRYRILEDRRDTVVLEVTKSPKVKAKATATYLSRQELKLTVEQEVLVLRCRK